MKTSETSLPSVVVLEPTRFQDSRGFFSEVYNRQTLEKLNIVVEFVQDNHSLSRDTGTVRGLHYQSPPYAQDKLVRVSSGSILDVAVDARIGSAHYGKWVSVELSSYNGLQLFIPKGFLHGFITLEPNTEIIYKCSDYYSPECDGSVRFDDPALGIDWGANKTKAILSDKDRDAQGFADFDSPFTYQGS